MRRSVRFTIELLAVLLLCGCSSALLGATTKAAKEVPWDEKTVPQVSGDARFEIDTVSIGGQIYDGWICISEDSTFDIRGYDRFRGQIGYPSGLLGFETESVMSIDVDGETVWKQVIRDGGKAIPVDIALTGRRALTFRCSSSGGNAIAEPRLIKGQPAMTEFKCPVCGKTFKRIDDRDAHVKAEHGGGPPPTVVSGAFIVDPNDLDKLAGALRKRVDANAGLKTRIDQGNIALMTFELISVPSKTVAKDVAENLSTSMINASFSLVERGQLDKAIQELKLQETGLIDPTTAQKLGKMAGCDFIVVGSISDQDTFVVINARILETATGKAVAAERVELRKIKRN